MRFVPSVIAITLFTALDLFVGSERSFAGGMIQYNRDIRPILSDNCFACHGPDANKRAADLRLDVREDAIKNSIVPNQPDQSELLKRILTTDEDAVMPPPSSHKSLTNAQKELIKQWIAEGAEYQGHWSFIPPIKPELPQVRNGGWVRNPIDRFVLAELERRGLEPAPEADLRTLIRRVCLDLTGLPPTPDEIKRVLEDPSPERYENYVDELLKRTEWGEHRGRYWLDYARYADTHGIHFDNFREMWSYREWVINAFNQNKPFDEFTIEQLAGDLLPNADLDQKIATGFNRNNITTNEGGAIDEEYKVLYTRDRVETTGQVWLGLTVGCAVCHDHKFDPISQSEFYQLAAFFNNTTQNAMDGNIKDTPPIVPVPLAKDRQRFEALDGLIENANASLTTRREAARAPFEAFVSSASEKEQLSWKAIQTQAVLEAHIPLSSENKRWLDVVHQNQSKRFPLEKEGTIGAGFLSDSAWQVADFFPALPIGDIERETPFSISLWVKPSADNQGGAYVGRMDEGNAYRGWDVWAENGFVGMHIINKWPDNALKAVSSTRLSANQWNQVTITYDGSSKASGIRIYVNGKESGKNVQKDTLTDTIQTTVPFRIGSRNTSSPTTGSLLQDIRVYRGTLEPEAIQDLASLGRRQYLIGKANRSVDESNELFDWFLKTKDDEAMKWIAEVQNLTNEKAELRARGTVAHIMNEATSAPMAYVLARGDYDKRTVEVKPGTPKVLPPMPEDLPRNRLGLAKWLLLPNHPLTARVTVNRFWQEVFGQGLVGSSGDFGVTGQSPTNPELLDYLAISFRDDRWNIKNFFRSVVTSSTYRQSAAASPEKMSIDPQNKLLARGPRFRMDAEMLRDSALSASGLLVSKIGGPSVRPYQPSGVWEAVAMPGSNTRDYMADKGEGLYRRSIYTFLKRAAPPPNMEVFNATAREVCTIKRERTNTPLQALVTLNDPQFVEAARILATRALENETIGGDPSARIQWIAEWLIGRPFRVEELQVTLDGVSQLQQFYQQNPEQAQKLLLVGETKSSPKLDQSELAAWTMLCNELMNLDEVLTK